MTREEKDAACAWWNQRVLLEQKVDKNGTITQVWALPADGIHVGARRGDDT